jgi:hypothetical protein
VKYGDKESAQTCSKNHSRMVVYIRAETVGVLSESEVLVMFVHWTVMIQK